MSGLFDTEHDRKRNQMERVKGFAMLTVILFGATLLVGATSLVTFVA